VSGVDIATRTTLTTYDAQGRFATAVANALNQSETWQYDARFGKPTSHTGPNGLTTTWSYDTFGRKTLEVRADGAQTRWAYQFCSGVNGGTATCVAGAAYLIQATPLAADGATQNGPTGIVYYDTLDREIARDTQGFDASTIRSAKQYDGVGRVQRASKPYFVASGTPQWTTFTYDALGRAVTELAPDSSTTHHAFHGLVTTDTNALGQTRTVTRNSQGQVILVTDALGKSTTFAFDPFGNLVETIDASGNAVTNTYDVRGRKVASHDPDLGGWSYAYDTAGELLSQIDAKSQTTTFSYDVLGRLIQRVEPDMTSIWVYDTAANGIGKLASARITAGPSAGYARAYTYDTLGRPVQAATTIASAVYAISATYDANSRLGTVTYPSGFAVTYGYTSLGYAQQLADNTGKVHWIANARDAEQHLTQQTAGNGIVTIQTFDQQTSRLLGITAGTSNGVESLSYTYDLLGNMLARQDGNAGLAESFAYDSLNRLTAASVSLSPTPLVKTFSYDAIGNLLSKSDVGDYVYPEPGSALPHAVTSIGGGPLTTTFSYDANGNQVAGLGRSIVYTSYNKPASISQGAKTIGFSDDVDHQRILQTSPEGNTIYLDAFGVHIELFIAATSQWNEFLSVGGTMIGLHVLRSDETVSTRYFHKDHLGSIAVITDETGAVVERLSYDAWGKRRFANGTDDPTGSITSQTTRGFTGQEELADVGLVHLNGRVYDPVVGRMLSADPFVPDPTNGQAWNRYSYVINNPLAFTDPNGYCFLGLCGLGNAIGSAISSIGKAFNTQLLLSVFKIGAVAICAVTPGCAPFIPLVAGVTSAVIAGVTTGRLDQALMAGVIAGATAVAFNAVGDITLGPGHPAPAFGSDAYWANVAGHALVGCGQAVASGGKCEAGALAGGITSLAGPFINGKGFSVQSLVANSVLGGLASVAGGGKFANGAVTGAFGYLFNAAAGCMLDNSCMMAESGGGGRGIGYAPAMTVAGAGAFSAWASGQLSDLRDWLVSNMAAVTEGSGAGFQVHGNSSLSQDPTEVYYLINRSSGDIDKIGVTSNPAERYSQAYLDAENVDYVTQTLYSSRYPALVDENIRLTWYQINTGKLPRLNLVTR